MRIPLIVTTLFFLLSLSAHAIEDSPSWYLNVKQNNAQSLFGVAEGYSLEEATRFALADAAARLMVSISSESSMIREENQNSVNEELHQNVRQNIEKINFTNYTVKRNAKIDKKFFIEVEIEREPFINEQKEQLGFLETQVNNLENDLVEKNTVQKRSNLLQIIKLYKEIELRGRILQGAGIDVQLGEKLNKLASFKDQLSKLSDKIEFYFDKNSPVEITKIIRSALNKEKIKVVSSHRLGNKNEVTLQIKLSSRSNKIYEAFMTKIEIDFENSIGAHTIASNTIEVSGSSSLGEKESYLAALKSLEEEIAKNGVLKAIGILND
jgi:hypothetical protein